MKIELELGTLIDMALRSNETDAAFHTLAEAATAQATEISGDEPDAAFQRARLLGVAKALSACAPADNREEAGEWELVID